MLYIITGVISFYLGALLIACLKLASSQDRAEELLKIRCTLCLSRQEPNENNCYKSESF